MIVNTENIKLENDKKDEKMKNTSSIYEAMSPAQYFLRLTGSICYYRNKTTGEFKKSYVLIFCNFIYLIGQIFFSVYIFKRQREKSFTNSMQFIFYIEKSPFLTSPLSILLGQIFTMKKTEIILALEKIDSKFKAFGEGSKLLQANNKISYSCKVRIAIAVVLFLMIEITNSLCEFMENGKFFHFVMTIFVLIPLLTQEVELLMFCCAIKSRFKVINQIFKQKIEESQQVDKYPINKYLFSRTLKVLLEQHEDLRKITEKLIKIFAMYLLNITLAVIAIFTSDGIRIVSTIVSGDVNQLIMCLYWIRNIASFVLILAIICHDVDSLTNQANKTLFLMHGIQVRIDDTDSIKLLILSTMYMNNNKLKITVFELFGIDFALVLIICGAALSYLVITFQFLQHKQLKRTGALALDENLTNIQLPKLKD